MKKIMFIIITLLTFIPIFVNAESPITITIFYGEGCPHCRDLENFLEELKYDENYEYKFNVVKYEIRNNEENALLQQKVAAYFENNYTSVPYYIIGNTYDVGFPEPNSESATMRKYYEETTKIIKDRINDAYRNQDLDLVEKIKNEEIIVKEETTGPKVTIEESDPEERTGLFKDKKNIIVTMLFLLLGLVILVISTTKITKKGN